MALVAAVCLGFGVYTLRTRRVPGPMWLRSVWRKVPPWQTGVAFVVLGVSSSLWAVSMFLGTTWAPLLAWLVTGAGLLFITIAREREADQEAIRRRRAWYRLPSTADTDGTAHSSEAHGDPG
jgi:hypothetical protein